MCAACPTLWYRKNRSELRYNLVLNTYIEVSKSSIEWEAVRSPRRAFRFKWRKVVSVISRRGSNCGDYLSLGFTKNILHTTPAAKCFCNTED